MLQITIPKGEYWDEVHERFLFTKEVTLRLEHSLISISKWESKWCVPFYSSTKTKEQLIDYVRCMCLNSDVDPEVFNRLTVDNINEINEYVGAPMTATTVNSRHQSKKMTEVVTSELIYYWMIEFGIPVQFEKWHLNRLMMLIRVCSEKAQAPQKMNQREIMAQNRALNQARRAKLRSKG